MQDPERSADVSIHPSSTAVVRFGEFFFDRDNHLLSTEDGEITLPPRVLAILDLLVERAGAVVAKETIMGAVWREACVGDTSLTEAISLLRQALGDNPRDPTFIQTVHRRGYRFVAAVEVVGRAGGPLARDVPLSADPAEGETRRPFPTLSRPATVIAAAVAIGILIAGLWFARGRTGAPRADVEPIRLDVSSPQGVFVPFFTASALALSPDGDDLVFVGRLEDGDTSLFRRRISEFESEAISGTDGAGSPFFSPDGEWVAFFSEGELRKTPIGGGAVIPICESPFGFGGSWAEDGTIVFAGKHPSGLSAVSADGGPVRNLTQLRVADGEIGHWWPQVLPGDRGVLFAVWSSSLATSRIAVLDHSTGRVRTLVDGGSYPRYTEDGSILYLTPGGLASASFDLDALEIVGTGGRLVDQPRSNPFIGVAHIAVARSGTMAYLPVLDAPRNFEITRVSLAGREETVALDRMLFRNLRVSPDGRRLAVTALDGTRSDVWTTTLDEPKLDRLTFEGFNIEPRWSPDGEWVVFASNRDGPFNIYRKRANGEGVAERVSPCPHHQYPGAFSPDGSSLVYSVADPDTGMDIWMMSFSDGEIAVTPTLATPANENLPTVSPDGRWMAYVSDDTGRWEVYVRSMSGGGIVRQVSRGGGGDAFWSADGSVLYYVDKNEFVSVSVSASPELRLGPEEALPWDEAFTVVDSTPDENVFIAIKDLTERPLVDAVRVVVSPG